MATEHFERFAENIAYARRMIVGGRAIAELRGAEADFGDLSEADPGDLFRAAWLQAVSALDHWLHMEILDHAVALVAASRRPLPDRLEKLRFPYAALEEMAGDSTATVFSEYVREEIRRDTYQRSKGISEGLRLVTDLKSDEIWARIGEGRKMTANAARRQQDAIADRRNRIAHRADLDDGGERTPMSAKEAKHTVHWIAYVADRIAGLLQQSMRGVRESVPKQAWVFRSGRCGRGERWPLEGNALEGLSAEVPDLSEVDGPERMRKVVEGMCPGSPADRIDDLTARLWTFRRKIAVGDLVVLPVEGGARIAIGRVVGDYVYDPDAAEERRHHRRVEWLCTDVPAGRLRPDLLASLDSAEAICRVWGEHAMRRFMEVGRTGEDPGARPARKPKRRRGPSPSGLGPLGRELFSDREAPKEGREE